MFPSGLICVLKTLQFQESDLNALKVIEIGFGSWMSLIVLLNKIEKYPRLEVLKQMKTNFFYHIAFSLLSCMSIEPLMQSERLVWFAHVFKLSLSGISACERVYPKHSFQHKHFAWLKVNSYKSK